MNLVQEFRRAAWNAWAPRNALHVRFFLVYASLLELAASRLGYARLYREHARCLQLQKHWWREIQALDQALAKRPNSAFWHYRRAQVRERMNHYRAAAADYRRAIELRSEHGRRVPGHWHYREGHVLNRIGTTSGESPSAATRAFEAAIAADHKLDARRLGIGVFHQERGFWPEALAAYAHQAAARQQDPLIYHRWGLAAERCWEWKRAEKAYRGALELPSPPKGCIFRYGYVLERLGLFKSAAERYREALSGADEDKHTVSYRLGCALAEDGQWDEASRAFASATPRRAKLAGRIARFCSALSPIRISAARIARRMQRRKQSPRPRAHTWLIQGFLWECASCAKDAVAAYAQGEALLEARSTFWLARHAQTLHDAGSPTEACVIYRRMHPEPLLLGNAAGLGRKKSKDTQARSSYAVYLESLPIQRKTVLLESYFGASVSCNPYAIFRTLQTLPAYRDWKFLWVIDRNASVPTSVSADQRVCFVRRESDAYRRHLASAEYLVSNSTFPTYFVRRPDQLYLNTWHGTPLKTMGRDIKSTFMERENTARNFLHATHLLSPNRHTSETLIDRYDIRDTFSGELLETGYPRIDLTLRAGSREKAALRATLGLSANEKVVLYAPTWRGRLGQTRSESKTIEGVIRALRRLPCRVLFRGHYFVERRLGRGSWRDCLVPADVDTNELLSIVDVLITDYSSIFFDYLPTGRPLCFYAYDLEQYESERGMYFPLTEMPGAIFREPQALAENVRQLLEGTTAPDDRYDDARLRFCPHEDGRASQRAVEAFFASNTLTRSARHPSVKPSLLMYPGALMPNGITTSFLNLTFHLANTDCSTTSAIDTGNVALFAERREQLGRVAEGVSLLGRPGRMVVTEEDWRVVLYFDYRHDFAGPAMRERYHEIFAREYRRLFGDAHFDTLIEFSGYSVYWSSVLGAAPTGRKLIYQHNDMISEWRHRFPSLESVFRIYEWYDNIIAVSQATMELNRQNLAADFQVPKDKFFYSRNLQNPEEILRQAAEPLTAADHLRFFADRTPVFVTVGRLSAEKDQAKLIRAFAALRADHPHARLLVIGDGPLRPQLQKLIASLGQNSHIHLLGQQSNPHKWLACASCFVLPSNYEGQPMVLFEALILGKPIIATNITGNRSVLDSQTALLVDNNESALRQGMRDFLDGLVPAPAFDIASYNRQALREFLDLALHAPITKHRAASTTSETEVVVLS
jgi:CDP-glycerol glycerophosphotransferase